VQRPSEAAFRKVAIEFGRPSERIGVDRDDGIQRRSVLVIRSDAVQVLLDQGAAGEMARRDGRVDTGDCGFFNSECLRRRRL
jgi:hypothetical protein